MLVKQRAWDEPAFRGEEHAPPIPLHHHPILLHSQIENVQILLPDEAKRFHAGLKAEHDSNDKATLMRLQESLELKSLELKKYRIGEREELKEYLEAKKNGGIWIDARAMTRTVFIFWI